MLNFNFFNAFMILLIKGAFKFLRLWPRILVLWLSLGMGFAHVSLAGSRPELSQKDLVTYQQAFADIAAGKTDLRLNERDLSDPLLLSYVEFNRLFSPKTQASYQELTNWLSLYGDHPYAQRVWALAKKRNQNICLIRNFPVSKQNRLMRPIQTPLKPQP